MKSIIVFLLISLPVLSYSQFNSNIKVGFQIDGTGQNYLAPAPDNHRPATVDPYQTIWDFSAVIDLYGAHFTYGTLGIWSAGYMAEWGQFYLGANFARLERTNSTGLGIMTGIRTQTAMRFILKANTLQGLSVGLMLEF